MSGEVPASFWRRALSFTVGFLLPVSLVRQTLSSAFTGRSEPPAADIWLYSSLAYLIVVALTALTARAGEPLRYRMVGLRAETASGEPASRWRLAGRDLAHTLDFLTLFWGFVRPLISPSRQTLGDHIAKVYVVNAAGA